MDDASLGGIVCGLQLRDVNNVSAHAGRCDEGSICIVLQLLPVHVGPFLLLTSPVCSRGSGTIKGAVKIGSDNLAVVINLSVEHGSLRPRDTGVGNEDVEASIELLDDFVDHLMNVLRIGDVDLVGLA